MPRNKLRRLDVGMDANRRRGGTGGRHNETRTNGRYRHFVEEENGDVLFLSRCSSEREAERLNTGIKKFDFELTIGDRSLLPDQLIKSLLGNYSFASFVNVISVGRPRRLSIDQHAESHR